MPRIDPHPTNIFEYLSSLQEPSLAQLYRTPIFALSFLKLFEENALRFIFDLLIKSFGINALKEMRGIKSILKTLLRIRLIERRGMCICLNDSFRDALKRGLCILTVERYFSKSGSRVQLNEGECSAKFESVLRSIVNKEYRIDAFGAEELLAFGGLVDRERHITNRGFEFLLKTKQEQLWCLVFLALKYFLPSVEEELAGLEAIFELSTKNSSVLYQQLEDVDKSLLRCLESLGLMRMDGSRVVLSTSFIQLFETSRQLKEEFIIMETNYKIYAYTQSEYKKSIIHLFCNVVLELPNFIKGVMTEESLNRAYDKGITSSQIIHFLRSSVIEGYLPPTVSNQIEIWESKRNRMEMVPGYLYSNFLNLSDYQRVLQYCIESGFLVESDLDKRIIVVRDEAHEHVREYVKSIM
jgi:transcription initiation factor TFIIH subunit 4